MSKTKIKICGLTSACDARFCVEAGAEMLGLNFSPKSPRCLSLAAARKIISAVGSPTKFVGVFVDQPRTFVEETTQELALDAVQLHGDESAEYLRDLCAPFVIKALHIRSTPAEIPESEAVLFDTWKATSRGGTGETFDWSIAAALRPRVKYLILAGGLNERNVAEAIRVVRPDVVDVCSGVEDSPGRKNAAKVRRFIEATRP